MVQSRQQVCGRLRMGGHAMCCPCFLVCSVSRLKAPSICPQDGRGKEKTPLLGLSNMQANRISQKQDGRGKKNIQNYPSIKTPNLPKSPWDFPFFASKPSRAHRQGAICAPTLCSLIRLGVRVDWVGDLPHLGFYLFLFFLYTFSILLYFFLFFSTFSVYF